MSGSGEVKKEFKKQGIALLVSSIIKVPVVAVTVYLLAIYYPGEWIKCRFFESNACSPKVNIEYALVNLDSLSLDDIDEQFGKYRIINRLIDLDQKYIVYKKTLKIKSRGVNSIGQTSLKLTFLPVGSKGEIGKWVGYGIDDPSFLGDINAEKELKEIEKSGIPIKSFQFSKRSRLGKQEAVVYVLVAYPKELREMKQSNLCIVTVTCPQCRENYREVSKYVAKS
jgi:hypothetical protein